MNPQFPVHIAGTGSYVPAQVLSNAHFISYLDTSEEWIRTRTGIRERRTAEARETTATMGAEAARAALRDAGRSIDEVDLIVCATATGDCPFPATATFIQGALSPTRPIPAFDVGAACAGFLFGTAIAVGMLTSRVYRRALVIGAETLTRFADMNDRTTCVLFGDGAGAAVLERKDDSDSGVLYNCLGCDGTKAEYIWVPAGGSRLPASPTTVAERLHFLRMRGREVFKFAVLKMQELIDEALASTGTTAKDIAMLIPHQSNLRIIESVRERMGLPAEKVSVTIDRYGNTSAASIPIALDEARRDGRLKKGDLVLMVAIGAGLAWGVMMIRL